MPSSEAAVVVASSAWVVVKASGAVESNCCPSRAAPRVSFRVVLLHPCHQSQTVEICYCSSARFFRALALGLRAYPSSPFQTVRRFLPIKCVSRSSLRREWRQKQPAPSAFVPLSQRYRHSRTGLLRQFYIYAVARNTRTSIFRRTWTRLILSPTAALPRSA